MVNGYSLPSGENGCRVRTMKNITVTCHQGSNEMKHAEVGRVRSRTWSYLPFPNVLDLEDLSVIMM